ncbi:MAG: hypothetical protein KJO08_05250 [Gammaproteobacteria bacterium]|nr:hypothetical protein [Gammaproteobacteria bacterium]NNJ84883.1 hypothetical protein [Gammaproteobacteria bacterium]
MSSIGDILKETLSLTRSVGQLESVTTRLADKVDEHSNRILKLEMREETLKKDMANTALQAVSEMNARMVDRITQIEYTTGIKKLPSAEKS